MWPGKKAPDGWMICDGHPLSSKQYPDLYAVLENTCGKGEVVIQPDRRRILTCQTIVACFFVESIVVVERTLMQIAMSEAFRIGQRRGRAKRL